MQPHNAFTQVKTQDLHGKTSPGVKETSTGQGIGISIQSINDSPYNSGIHQFYMSLLSYINVDSV